MTVSTNRSIDNGSPSQKARTQPLAPASVTSKLPPAPTDAPPTPTLTDALDIGSSAAEKAHSTLKIDGLETFSGALATPGAVLHLAETGMSLLQNPTGMVQSAGQIVENPVESVQNTVETLQGLKDSVQTVQGAAELAASAVETAANHIKEHGIKKGLAKTGRHVRSLATQNYAQFKESISTSSGGGLSHVARELAATTESRTTRRVTRALSQAIDAHPELAPTGLFARARVTVTNGLTRASEAAHGMADRAADAVAGAMTRSKAGRAVLNGLDFINPARHVSETALAQATREGTKKGVAAATETVINRLQKAGHQVTRDATGSITRIVSKTGQEVAVESLQRATRAGVQAAAREGAEAGVKMTAKGLGRFAPGVNIAIAAYDINHARQVWADPNASGWQKGMASVTALGSMAAASNIPIVSQAGAGISLVSSVLENIPPTVLADAGQAALQRVSGAAQATARGITSAGSTLVNGAGKALGKVGRGLKKLGGLFGA
jgi:hypothetical protein